MNTDVAQDRIKAALKQALKKQNSTYSDVAKVWDCSVPTVKRLLGPEEMPLSRLLTLLDWLNLSLTDLQKLSESDMLDRPRFTARQNEFLAKNPAAFALFMKLYEDETPASIAKKYGIAQATLDRYVLQLERYDLVRVGAGGKIKPAWPRVPTLEGPLGQLHFKNIMDRFNTYFKYQIGKALIGRKNEGSTFMWSTFPIREATYKEFKERLHKLLTELSDTSTSETHQYKKSELKTGVYMAGFHLDESDSPDLRLVNDTFADMLRESV